MTETNIEVIRAEHARRARVLTEDERERRGT